MFHGRQSWFQAVAFFLIVLVALTQSRNVDIKCADKQAQQNFNMSKFQGKWWGLQFSNRFGRGPKCVSINIKLDPQSGVSTGDVTQMEDQLIRASFTIIENNPTKHEGKLTLVPTGNGPKGLEKSTFSILSTDYTTYSIWEPCDSNSNHILVLGRQQTFATERDKEAFFTKTNNILASLGFDTHDLKDVDNENCNFIME